MQHAVWLCRRKRHQSIVPNYPENEMKRMLGFPQVRYNGQTIHE